MQNKNKNSTKENMFSKDGIENINKIKLQEFYGSFFGKNIEEVKMNSRKLRLKIYGFGFFIIIILLFLNFFIFGKISFVTS